MTDRGVRLVRADDDAELTAYLRGIHTAFLSNRDVDERWLAWARDKWQLDRSWAAFENGQVCGSARTFASGVRLPGGGEVPVSCLTAVTVLPTHTRRGHVTELMRAQLEAAIEAGEVASLLIAAEWPIYGRFGYGPAVWWTQWEVDLDRVQLRPDLPPPSGRSVLVTPEEYLDALPVVLAGAQAATPGDIRRPESMYAWHAGLELHPGDEPQKARVQLVHYGEDGRPDGVCTYDPTERWDGMRPTGTVQVVDMIWSTPVGERELWRHLCTIDLVSTLTYDGPVDCAVRSLLADGRVAHAKAHWDEVWAVVLDVPAAFSARSYTGAGEVTFEVVDRFLDRGGRFTLAADGSGAGTCTPAPAGAPADVTLSLSDLSACWLGGTQLAEPAVGGRIDEHRTGAVDEFGRLLAWHRPPFCFTHF